MQWHVVALVSFCKESKVLQKQDDMLHVQSHVSIKYIQAVVSSY